MPTTWHIDMLKLHAVTILPSAVNGQLMSCGIAWIWLALIHIANCLVLISKTIQCQWVYMYMHGMGVWYMDKIASYPTEAILQRHLQCDISDTRQYWVITTWCVIITKINIFCLVWIAQSMGHHLSCKMNMLIYIIQCLLYIHL